MLRIFAGILCAVVSLIFFDTQATCQKIVNLKSYNSTDGLSQNNVYSIAQTKDGFMWFGTQDGLNRFDGKCFKYIDLHKNVSSEDQLKISAVSRMIVYLHVDSRDKLWVATTNGIVFFDRFRNKTLPSEKVYSGFSMVNSDKYVKKIIEDKKNDLIWVLAGANNLYCYSLTENKMIFAEWQDSMPTSCFDILMDKNDNLWIGSTSGLFLFRNKKILSTTFLPKEPAALGYFNAIALVNNKLWITVAKKELFSLTEVAPLTFALKNITSTLKWNGPRPIDISRIHQSDSNFVWFGTFNNGVYLTCLTTNAVQKITGPNNDNSLSNAITLSFFSLKDQPTWIATNGKGILKYLPPKSALQLWRCEATAGVPNPSNHLNSLYSANDSDFYIGAVEMIYHRNLVTGKVDFFPLHSQGELLSAYTNWVFSICKEDNDNLWISTSNGLHRLNKRTRRSDNVSNEKNRKTQHLASVIKLKKQNALLTGGFNKSFLLYNLQTGQWESPKDKNNFLAKNSFVVRYMVEAENGDVYMGTQEFCLLKYNYLTGEFTRFPQFEAISGMSRHFTFAKDILWVGTEDGLIQASSKDFKVHHVWNTENGLSNNIIYAVVADDYGWAWAGSNKGITAVDPKRKVCKIFTEEDGLQSQEFLTASCHKSKDGSIWFGGINGLNKINPREMLGEVYSPKPIITEIKVMNSPLISDTTVCYLKEIRLPNSKNFVDIMFQSPNYHQERNIVYRHMLTGVDTGWVYDNNRTYASYTQLKPGCYTFRVQAASANNTWSQGTTELVIIITSPWYASWWAVTLGILLLTLFIYTLLQFRFNQIRRVERMRNRISADLHDDIGSTLTGINLLSQIAQSQEISQEKRNKFLGEIVEQTGYVIQSLKDIIWDINTANEPLEKDIERMKKYAVNVLTSKDIQYNFVADSKCLPFTLRVNQRQNLFLVFKEALHNLVKYSNCTQVTISISCNKKMLKMQIIDNGKGFNFSQVKRGNGINNMEKRAREIYGDISIESTYGQGTSVSLSFKTV